MSQSNEGYSDKVLTVYSFPELTDKYLIQEACSVLQTKVFNQSGMVVPFGRGPEGHWPTINHMSNHTTRGMLSRLSYKLEFKMPQWEFSSETDYMI